MIRYVFITLLLALSMGASAQNNIYVGADAGFGSSWPEIHYRPGYVNMAPASVSGISIFCPELFMGCSAGRWSFQWGIGILSGGYERSINYNSSGATYQEQIYYPAVIFPLIAGYEVRLGKRWSLVPHAGFIIGQNQSAQIKTPSDNNIYDMPSSEFRRAYHEQSIWATFDAEFRYHLGRKRRHSIFIAPRFNLMLTNMTKDYSLSIEHADLRLNSFAINIGASRYFKLGGERRVRRARRVVGTMENAGY